MGKKSAPPPPPDYAALAKQQAELDKTAAQEQTVANRPTQNTPWGSTSWTQNPDGQWTENLTLDPAEQSALDQQRQFDTQKQGIASGLLDKAGTTLGQPLSLEGLPELQGFDMSKLGELGKLDLSSLPQLQGLDLSGMNKLDPGFGAVEGVRDAMMGRMAPARQQSRDAEIQRLKNQGIPEDSDAFQRAVKRIDEGDTDANQQALLASMGAYGDIFQRGLAGNDQTLKTQLAQAGLSGDQRAQLFGEQAGAAALSGSNRAQQMDEQGKAAQLSGLLRQQSLAEQEKVRQSPLDDFTKLTTGISPTSPTMPSFMSGTGYKSEDSAGAAKDAYQAMIDQTNAKNQGKSNTTSGLVGLASVAAMVF